MSGIVFLGWSLGFWPAIYLAVFLSTGVTPSFVDSWGFFTALGFIWIIGMIRSYILYRIKQGVEFKNDEEGEEKKATDESPNTVLVVEAPSLDDANAVHGEHIESKVYFASPPKVGERLALNEEDGHDSDILGTVEEVARSAHSFKGGGNHCVWVKLDRPEDYCKLYTNGSAWNTGTGARRRSTSPVLDIHAPQT